MNYTVNNTYIVDLTNEDAKHNTFILKLKKSDNGSNGVNKKPYLPFFLNLIKFSFLSSILIVSLTNTIHNSNIINV